MELHFGMFAQKDRLRGHHAAHKGISASKLYCGALSLGQKMGTIRQIVCGNVFHPKGVFLFSWSEKKFDLPCKLLVNL